RHIPARVLLDELADVALGRQHRPDAQARELPEPVDGGQRLRLGHGDGQLALDLEHRDDLEPLGLLLADEAEQSRVDQAVAELAAGHSELAAEGADERGGVDHTLADEGLAEPLSRGALLGEGPGELLFGQRAFLEQRFAHADALGEESRPGAGLVRRGRHRKLLTAAWTSSYCSKRRAM